MQKKIYESTFQGCTSLSSIILPASVSSIGANAFSGCTKLKEVNLGKNVIDIGVSAFYGDTQLTNVDRFNDPDSGHTFDTVGNFAFANTGLSSVNLALRSSAIQTFWGDGVFQNCKNLQKVHFISANYMSKDMFKGCTKLSDVAFDVNFMAYTYPGVFNGCTALSTITMPSQLKLIAEDMFKDCSALKTVGFNSYDFDKSGVDLIQKNAFNGAMNIEDFHVPASITSFDCIEDASLSNCSIKNIHFHGLNTNTIINKQNTEFNDDLYFGKPVRLSANQLNSFIPIYNLAISKLYKMCIVINQCWHENYSGDASQVEYKQAISSFTYQQYEQFAKTRKAMFLWIDDYIGKPKSVDELTNLRTQISNVRNQKFYSGTYDDVILHLIKNGLLTDYYINISSYPNRHQLVITLYGKTGDDGLPKHAFSPSIKTISDFQKVNVIASNFKPDQSDISFCKEIYEFTNPIRTSGMFRLNRNCQSFTADGKSIGYKYNFDSNMIKAYVPPVIYDVDKTTTTNFQLKKWYYRAQELYNFARSHNTPCLFIYSLLGCGPCQIYQSKIWSSPIFQNWFKEKTRFYLCCIECDYQPIYDDSLRFCSDILSKQAKNFSQLENVPKSQWDAVKSTAIANAYGEKYYSYLTDEGLPASNLMTPVLVFMDKDGNCWDYTYHNLNKTIAKKGIEGTINDLTALCLYHFANNDPKDQTYMDTGYVEPDPEPEPSPTPTPPPAPTPSPDPVKPSWLIEPNIVDLRYFNINSLDQAYSAIKRQVESTVGEPLDGYYLGGCLFYSIVCLRDSICSYEPFDEKSYELEELDLKSISNGNKATALMSEWLFLIGDSYYKMSFVVGSNSTNDMKNRKQIKNPCLDDESKIYIRKFEFVKV